MTHKITIMGAGPAGYAAALAGAQSGLEVTLIERDKIGGTCLNRGCIPTKSLLACSQVLKTIKSARNFGISVSEPQFSLPAMIARKDKIVKTLRQGIEHLLNLRKVRMVYGSGYILNPREIKVETPGASPQVIKHDSLIIATGSSPLMPWTGPAVISSDEALDLQELPKTMLIVGSGAVGIEFACFFSELGVEVTVAELLPEILPLMEKECASLMRRELKKMGVKILTNLGVKTIEAHAVTFTDDTTCNFDVILTAVGRKPVTADIGLNNLGLNTIKAQIPVNDCMQTSIPGVYAIGDIVADTPMLAHKAFAEAMVAIHNIASSPQHIDYTLVPDCIYAHPEMAGAGLKPDEYLVAVSIPFRTLGRAHGEGNPEGMLKLVVEPGTLRLKGVHIIGARASDLIHEGLIALKSDLNIRQLCEVMHAHPTFAEIYQEAFHKALNMPLHSL